MQTLNNGQRALIELVAGQALYLDGFGIAASDDGYSAIGVTVNGWPVTVGPLSQNRFITIEALGELQYEMREEEGIAVKMVSMLFADLPDVGKSGVIYETESGAVRFDANDGTYKALDDGTRGTSVPNNDFEPVIAGAAEVDATLTLTSQGVWEHRPTSFSYQWTIDDVEVEGETFSTFVVPVEAEGLDVKCEVTATNWAGSETTASNAITIPGGE